MRIMSLQIVELLDYFSHDCSVVLVFEFMPSGLWEVLHDSNNPPTSAHVKAYMRMLLKGVAYLHENGIMHRVSFSFTCDYKLIKSATSYNMSVFLNNFKGFETRKSNNKRKRHFENRRPRSQSHDVVIPRGRSQIVHASSSHQMVSCSRVIVRVATLRPVR